MSGFIMSTLRKLAMELEIGGVWSGVHETIAVLSDEDAARIVARCQSQEEDIRAKYR
jgi:hypothetical protein